MDIGPYVDKLRHDLAVAAEAGGQDARDLADRLTGPLESAARLVILEALAEAGEQISRDLAPASVDVRLRGRNPEFVVTPPSVPRSGAGPPERSVRSDEHADGDNGAMVRLNFRLSESLKQRMEEAAGHERLSLNAWLVRTVESELRDGGHRWSRGYAGHGYTGWVG